MKKGLLICLNFSNVLSYCNKEISYYSVVRSSCLTEIYSRIIFCIQVDIFFYQLFLWLTINSNNKGLRMVLRSITGMFRQIGRTWKVEIIQIILLLMLPKLLRKKVNFLEELVTFDFQLRILAWVNRVNTVSFP